MTEGYNTPGLGPTPTPAKTDTGAYNEDLWADLALGGWAEQPKTGTVEPATKPPAVSGSPYVVSKPWTQNTEGAPKVSNIEVNKPVYAPYTAPKPSVHYTPSTPSYAYSSSPKGYTAVDIDGQMRTVIGGPFDAFNGGIGVCLEVKSSKANFASLVFHVHDFGVPSEMDLENALALTIKFMRAHPNQVLYVGCKGGIGRTGMFIAALARATGTIFNEDPVGWVRREYLGHAVETPEQRKLVSSFSVERVNELVYGARKVRTSKRSFFSRLRGLFPF
jgi:hypothetical protein